MKQRELPGEQSCEAPMKSLSILTAALIGGVLATSPALAAGGGGGGGGGGAEVQCPAGKVYSKQKLMCVDPQYAPDEDLADHAYILAEDGKYQEALATLDLMQNPNTAKALNYRGYATRKLGKIEEGIGYYLQSVALDPEYTLVREYLGEAYVIQGRLDLAKEQLQEIEKRCGTTCEPYEDLAEAIEAIDS
jgi:tetratricopeptide (TPR) repeat protein